MKPFFFSSVLLLLVYFLAACSKNELSVSETTELAPESVEPTEEAPPEPEPVDPNADLKQALAMIDAEVQEEENSEAIGGGTKMKVGILVEGRPGLIKSPHAPEAGFIDVEGLDSGTAIQDHFSDQIILVP